MEVIAWILFFSFCVYNTYFNKKIKSKYLIRIEEIENKFLKYIPINDKIKNVEKSLRINFYIGIDKIFTFPFLVMMFSFFYLKSLLFVYLSFAVFFVGFYLWISMWNKYLSRYK